MCDRAMRRHPAVFAGGRTRVGAPQAFQPQGWHGRQEVRLFDHRGIQRGARGHLRGAQEAGRVTEGSAQEVTSPLGQGRGGSRQPSQRSKDREGEIR